MNTEIYRQVLIHYAIPSADKTQTIMDWPPQTPDLNIMDHRLLEKNKRRPQSKEELGSAEIGTIYRKISSKNFKSLSKKVQDGVIAGEGLTKY